MAPDGRRGQGGETEPDPPGLVELLLPRRGQCLVSGHRPPRAASAPSVASAEAQAEAPGGVTAPRSVPARRAGPGPLERSPPRRSVGERMSSCPRAGCRKTARPDLRGIKPPLSQGLDPIDPRDTG